MDKANSRLVVARLEHREVIRVSEKTEDLRFPRCWWADNLITGIDHDSEVPFVCSRVPRTISGEGKFEKGRLLLRTVRERDNSFLEIHDSHLYALLQTTTSRLRVLQVFSYLSFTAGKLVCRQTTSVYSTLQ